MDCLKEWLLARDYLLGFNGYRQDINLALKLASSCQHPDAVFLTSIVAGREISSAAEARELFLEHRSDPRALCFAALVDACSHDGELQEAADMGCALAQGELAGRCEDGDDKFQLAFRSANQGERVGFYWLAVCFHQGEGCQIDEERAKDLYKKAVDLDDAGKKVVFYFRL